MKVIENKCTEPAKDKIGEIDCPSCNSRLHVSNEDILEFHGPRPLGPIVYGGRTAMAPGYATFFCPCCNQVVTLYNL